MGDEDDLKAKIAALQGRIQQQKQHTSAPAYKPAYQGSSYKAATYHAPTYQRPAPYWAQQQYAPRPAPQKHRNKVLVIHNATAQTPEHVEQKETLDKPTAGGVTVRDRGHMQWTNAAIFDQRAQEKQKAMEQTALTKKRERDQRQRNRVIKHVKTHAPTTTGQPHEMVIADLRFRVASDGSKLIRIFGKTKREQSYKVAGLNIADGPNKNVESTPKQHKVAGVLFQRSKNGNLIRSSLVKKQRYFKFNVGKIEPGLITFSSRNAEKKSAKLCPSFTSTGTKTSYYHITDHRRQGASMRSKPCTCPQGNRCRFAHDINKLAICKDFLRHGECAAGEEACNLSHDPTPNRVPTCTHFIRGNCTKSDCRYAHLHVSPSAPVCRDFATLGYCDKGGHCTERHVTECPDYTNTGTCRNTKCRLPHIDTATNMRKAATAKAQKGSDDNDSDVSSAEEDHEEIDSDDADSDYLDEDIIMAGEGDGRELGQQQDFISF
ncbi:hypothetical protein MBLNU457_g0762t1 [Dothideomycetes sp. NU457]